VYLDIIFCVHGHQGNCGDLITFEICHVSLLKILLWRRRAYGVYACVYGSYDIKFSWKKLKRLNFRPLQLTYMV